MQKQVLHHKVALNRVSCSKEKDCLQLGETSGNLFFLGTLLGL